MKNMKIFDIKEDFGIFICPKCHRSTEIPWCTICHIHAKMSKKLMRKRAGLNKSGS
ncbi:MAG: hypothetical protein NT129_00435 [Candidatus Aenigmarchaeota archaeon]|nr:hypothetical protein [Candidatus Aenigmarchaeota archaeon]